MKTLFIIRKAATAMPLHLLLSASVVLVPGLWSQSQLKLIQPDLVRQGETFTGRVVEQTAADDVPLESGHVIFQGQVIPIEPGGRITLPAFVKEVGNTFVVAQVTRALAGNPSSTVTRHVEVVPVASNVPTRIAQASPILNPGGEVWGTGQGLKMAKAALVDQSGTQHDLGELFGSSLQVGGIVPHNLPSGLYHFVAWDAAGNRYEAPNASKCPTVELTGPRITHRGQTGEIIIRSDTDGSVVLSGGEPQIQLQLDQVTIPVRANQPAHVKFTAQQVGDYKVNGRLITPEGSSVLPDALKVDTTLEPLQTHYDPSRNQTQASIGMQVVDEAGHPVANAPVDIAVAHPNGVEYSRAVTNQQGHASFTQTFAGQLAADALSAHVYRVLGHPWKQDAECDCEDLTVKFDVRYDPKGRNNAGVAADVSKDRMKKVTIDVYLAVGYLDELKCEAKDNIGHCEGQIDVGVKSEWIHKPPEGRADAFKLRAI